MSIWNDNRIAAACWDNALVDPFDSPKTPKPREGDYMSVECVREIDFGALSLEIIIKVLREEREEKFTERRTAESALTV